MGEAWLNGGFLLGGVALTAFFSWITSRGSKKRTEKIAKAEIAATVAEQDRKRFNDLLDAYLDEIKRLRETVRYVEAERDHAQAEVRRLSHESN